MFDYPPAIRHLIQAFRQLPSVGPRSAERFALHLLNGGAEAGKFLCTGIEEATRSIRPCASCRFFSEGQLCSICSNPARDSGLVCIVEQATDVIAFEKSGAFRGRYYVLGGTLSPLDGIGPEELGLESLFAELKKRETREVILGLSPDVKGETTSLYLAGELKKSGCQVSRLATGVSVGSGLEFVDSITLGHALNDRKKL